MGKTIVVDTKQGALLVEEYLNDSYPGVTLYLNGQQCGIFECTGDQVFIRVWTKAGSEDPDFNHVIEMDPDNA